ncbi:hypothetical protein [Kordiimonas lacus]|uniref:Extracellular solute-binding protein, family 3 n=1 Tax=Kordiimonas lacus TaxID=637679 RepID=A0A1G7ABN4_9PROT|nr:hypothetical protein [Kordiimonas lacus]SDE12211.1 hypothetical protein SAMN04488071_2168 [Kordiimonas lacus]
MSFNALNRCEDAVGSARLLVCAAFALLLASIFAGVPPARALDDEAREESGCIRLASYSDLPMFQAVNGPIRKLYKEAGLCVELRYVPVQRAHGMQLQGRVHGQVGRSDAWLKDYGGDVVTLSAPIMRLDAMVAYDGKHGGRSMPATFEGRVVAHRPAIAWCSAWVKASGAVSLALQDFKDSGALLDSGRAEFVLFVSFKQQPLPALDAGAYQFAKVDDVVIYHVLAKDKAYLVPRLDAALERLGGADFFHQAVMLSIKAGG